MGSIAFSCLAFIGTLYSVLNFKEFSFEKFRDWLRFFSLLSVASLGTFSLSFSSMTLLQEFCNSDFTTVISRELQNGILSLRVASWLISTKALFAILRYTGCGSFINDDLSSNAEIYNHMLFTQYGIYIYSITALWYVTLHDMVNSVTISLSWALFFIADDWVIISGYLESFKGKILPAHLYRLTGFNIFISILMFNLLSDIMTFPWAFTGFVLMLYKTCNMLCIFEYYAKQELQNNRSS